MSSRSLLRAFTWCCLVAVALASVGAATVAGSGGRLSGVVRDPMGGAIVGAVVELRSSRAHVVGVAETARDGRFAIDAAPGRYIVAVRVSGFAPAERDVTVVEAGTASIADVTLDLAPLRVAVDVTAPALTRPLTVETDPRAPRQPVPAHDGADYLKTVPGFSVIRKGGTDGDPVLRGMAGSRLGILLDGENILGGCGNRMDPPTAYVFPAAYERVTIVKGPQAVAHGPGHSAGVVLFERVPSAYATPAASAYGASTVGSFGRYDLVAEIKAGNRLVNGTVSASRSTMDDYQDGAGRAVHSAYRRWSTNGAFAWTPRASSRLEVSGALSDGRAAYADRAMDGVKFARENVGLRFQQQNVSRLVGAIEAHAYYNYVDHVMDNFSLRPFKASMMMPARAVSNPDRETAGAKANTTLVLSTRATALVGIDWQSNQHRVRSSSNQAADPFEARARVGDASFDNVGAYAEATQNFGSADRLVVGGRADWWSAQDRRKTITTGAGTMVTVAPNPTARQTRRNTLVGGFARYEREVAASTTAYAGIGRARRAPDYWELFNKEGSSSISAFGAAPERTTQIDAGLRYRRGALSGSMSAFANTIDDFLLIESNVAKAVMGMNGTTTTRKATVTRNIDARTWGGEATLAFAATPQLGLDASLAYVRGENQTDDRPLAQQPPLEGRIGLQYSGLRWSMGTLARFVTAQDRFALNQGNIVGQDLGPTPAFAVLSVNAGWRVATFAVVTAGIDNVLDAQYAEFISRNGADVGGFTTTARINEPGRTMWVKLDLKR